MSYKKALPIISYEAFLEKVEAIHSYTSSNGRRYEVYSLGKDVLYLTRLDAKKQDCSLNLEKVYDAYIKLEDYSTITLKPFVSGKQSPTLGLLLVLELIACKRETQILPA